MAGKDESEIRVTPSSKCPPLDDPKPSKWPSVTIEEVEGELVCTGFAVSCTRRSREVDSFISLTFGDKSIPIADLPLYVFAAERKLARMSLLDAVAKGLFSMQDKKKLEDAQEKSYQLILDALVKARKNRGS